MSLCYQFRNTGVNPFVCLSLTPPVYDPHLFIPGQLYCRLSARDSTAAFRVLEFPRHSIVPLSRPSLAFEAFLI